MVKYYILGVLIVLGVSTISISNLVKFKAIEKAGNLPYCIQLPSGSEYTEAKNLFDLSLFKMWGTGGNNHAVLVVGSEEKPKFFHWSYWNRNFDDDAYGPPPIFCKPRNNFLDTKILYPEDIDNLNLYFAGQHFSIPRAFYPTVSWASRKALIFYAKPPEFMPSKNKDVNNGFTDIEFGHSPLLPSWLNDNDKWHRVEKTKPEFGLEKQLVYYRGNSSTGEIEKFANTQYFMRNNKGSITTLIICVDLICTHIFESNGWAYYFPHNKKDLDSWKTMQNKLEALVRSFVVTK